MFSNFIFAQAFLCLRPENENCFRMQIKILKKFANQIRHLLKSQYNFI